jgi:sporulation integral membrane protein YtvI
MRLEKEKAFLIHFIYIALILGISYFALKHILPVLMPFVIGLVVATSLKGIIDRIAERFHLKRIIVSTVMLIVFYCLIALLITLVGAKLISYLQTLFSQLPKFYKQTIEPAIISITDNVQLRFPEIETYFNNLIDTINDTIFSFLSDMSSTVLSAITGIAGQIPSLLIKFIFTIVSSFFFTIDYHRISDFVLRQFSEKKAKAMINIKQDIIGTLFKFLKGYITLMLITFFELSIGFMILRIPNPFLIAAVVSIVDILPILGTGAVLIPWSIIAFAFSNTPLGIGMLLLYLVITAVRQFLEPKIIGKQIGLHPIVTLISIFVGAQLLGVVGIFLLPVTVTILKQMNDEGTIHLFK